MKTMIIPGIKPLSSTWLLHCATNDGLYLKLYCQSALSLRTYGMYSSSKS